MKRYLTVALFLTSLILISSIIAFTAKASDQLSVKLIGCAGKPYANQKIQLQKLPCPDTDPKDCKWQTIETYTTDSNGEVQINMDADANIELDKHRYRFYWEKSRWVNSWVGLDSVKYKYIFGYDLENNFPQPSKAALNLNVRISKIAIAELEWSDTREAIIRAKANAITDMNVLRNEILDRMKTWDDPDKDEYKKSLNTYNIAVLRELYINITIDKEGSRRYGGPNGGYKPWCTLFSNFVLRQAGGPSTGSSDAASNAAAFGKWFQKSGNVRGLDGEMYSRSFFSRQNLLDTFKNTRTVPIQVGDFYLERHFGERSSGHSAIFNNLDFFPDATMISGINPYSVAFFPHDYNEKNDKTITYGAGQLKCVQNP